MLSHLRRGAAAAAAAAVFLVLVGATYQGVANALARREYPHPGRLVDVGGYQLHIDCRGRGTPTVVLEAAATGMSAAWAWVQPALERETRVCSYDRTGLGWSETGDAPADAAAVASTLRVLLDGAAEPPPYVFVGHGLGAAFAALHAAEQRERTAALVLIDAPFGDGRGRPPDDAFRLARASPWLARAGVLRATRMLAARADGLPEPQAGALRAFLNRPDHLTRAAHELRRWDETMRLAEDATGRAGVRTVHLTVSGSADVRFLTDQQEAARVTHAVAALIADLR